jgi:hypothetical protein
LAAFAKANGYKNVEFRLGDREAGGGWIRTPSSQLRHQSVYREDKVFVAIASWPGGRLTISDIVSEKPVPAALKDDLDACSACIAGALEKDDYLERMTGAGFGKVDITAERDFYVETVEDRKQHKFLSITVKAHKPRTRRVQPAKQGEAA